MEQLGVTLLSIPLSRFWWTSNKIENMVLSRAGEDDGRKRDGARPAVEGDVLLRLNWSRVLIHGRREKNKGEPTDGGREDH